MRPDVGMLHPSFWAQHPENRMLVKKQPKIYFFTPIFLFYIQLNIQATIPPPSHRLEHGCKYALVLNYASRADFAPTSKHPSAHIPLTSCVHFEIITSTATSNSPAYIYDIYIYIYTLTSRYSNIQALPSHQHP